MTRDELKKTLDNLVSAVTDGFIATVSRQYSEAGAKGKQASALIDAVVAEHDRQAAEIELLKSALQQAESERDSAYLALSQGG